MLVYVSAFLARRKSFPRRRKAPSVWLRNPGPTAGQTAGPADAPRSVASRRRGAMKTLFTFLLCAVLGLISSDGWAKTKHRGKRVAAERPHKSKAIRTRSRNRPRRP